MWQTLAMFDMNVQQKMKWGKYIKKWFKKLNTSHTAARVCI